MDRRKTALFTLLYLSEGAPIGFVWWALPALLSERGVPLAQIAALSATATLPWTLKFLAAPILDLLQQKGVSFQKQLWVLQLLLGSTAFSFIWAIEQKSLLILSVVLFFHAAVAATQDVCIDALAIRSARPEELGRLNGWMQAGMLLGRSVFGGAGLFLMHALGANLMLIVMGGLIWVIAILLRYRPLPELPIDHLIGGSAFQVYLDRIAELLKSQRTWALLGIALLTSFSFEGIAGVTSATLVKLEVPASMRSFIYAIAAPIMMVIGALGGGYMGDRCGTRPVLRITLVFCVALNLALAWAFDARINHDILVGLIAAFYLGIGAFTATLYAFLMKRTEPALAALQFSLLMAATNLCESLGTLFVGSTAERFGFLIPAVVLSALAITGLLLMPMVRDMARSRLLLPGESGIHS